MTDVPIWRYISLAKYIDLLATKSLFFPKASLFQDEAEGKWIGHAYLWGNMQRWQQSLGNAETLEALLSGAASDPEEILAQARRLLEEKPKTLHPVLKDVLSEVINNPNLKRQKYLESMIFSWRKFYNAHNSEVKQWSDSSEIYRQSTYISCWNHASSMSLAMWELYGGGRESVAIRTTEGKLKSAIAQNENYLNENGLKGNITEVKYIENLMSPSEKLRGDLFEILGEAEDIPTALFGIKPSVFEFESEIRAILFPNRNFFETVKDPHPDKNGFSLSINMSNTLDDNFIEQVYLHPVLGNNSMMFSVIKEINNKFGISDTPIIADRIEAFGSNVWL